MKPIRNIDRVNNWLDIPAKITPISLTLPQHLTYEQWAPIGAKITRINRFSTWALSDWINFGESKYGEMYIQAADATGFDPNYLAIIKHVGSRVDPSRRREKLSFGHHRLVAPLAPDEQERFLSQAEKHDWTREELREQIKAPKNLPAKNEQYDSNLKSVEASQPLIRNPVPEVDPKEIADRIIAELETLTEKKREQVVTAIFERFGGTRETYQEVYP